MADTVEKNIKLNIDSDIEPTLKNLRELKLALKSAAAGSDDFRKIQAKIDDVQDSLKGAKTSAGNFVDILGTVPGPLGDIGSKASGTIDILKSFGKLKLTDIKKSFMDLGGDLKDAGKGLANLTGLTKVYTKTNDFLSASFVKLGAAEGTAAVGAKAFSVALISTGIGAIIVGLGLLIGALVEFVSGEKAATAEIDKFNAAIDASNIAIQNQTDNLSREHQKQIADLKAKGATDKEIRDKELTQRREDYVNAQNTESKKLADLKKAYEIEDEDNRKAAIAKAQDDYRAATKNRKDLDTAYYVKAKENRGADLKDSQKAAADAAKKEEESRKESAAKAESDRKERLEKQKAYRDDRIAVAKEIANAEIEIEKGFNGELYNVQVSALKDQSKLAQDDLKERLKKKQITQKEYDTLKFQEESKLFLSLEQLEKDFIKKGEDANKALIQELADTVEEKKTLEINAEAEKFSKIKAGLFAEFQVREQNSEKTLKAQKAAAEDYNAKLALADEEFKKKKIEINDRYAKIESDKALADLKQQQEAEFLVYKQSEEKLRDEILKSKETTNTQKEEAERQYAENIRAYQQKQLEDQIALLETAAYETEEAKKAANLEILKLQDQLNQNLDSKYEEDQLNFMDALNKKVSDFLKNNQDLLEQINGTLQAAQSVVDAFQSFQDLKNLEENQKAEAERETQYNADVDAAKKASDAALAVEGVTAEQKKKIKYDYDKAVADADFKRAQAEYKLAKDQFDNGKDLQIASAIISTIQGGVQAFTSLASIPVIGPVLGAIAAAAALASGYAQVSIIKKTQYSGKPPVRAEIAAPDAGGAGSGSKFAQGGLLTGRKHSEGGIPTQFGQLEGGEYVVNRSATEAFMPLLDKINGMGKGSGAPNNLSVMGEQNIAASTPIIKTYVVASDMTSQQEANKRLEDIARL